MPWTRVDVFNQALRHLGITEFVQDPDSTIDVHANFLRGFFEEQVRTHLEGGDWAFARSYYTLAEPSDEESPFADLPYIYQEPPKCLVFRSVTDATIKLDHRYPWLGGVTEGTETPQRRIYTSLDDAIGVYTLDVLEHLGVWPYSFGGMIAAIMAYHYSGVRAPKKAAQILKIYEMERTEAKRVSARMQGDLAHDQTFHTPDYVAIRS